MRFHPEAKMEGFMRHEVPKVGVSCWRRRGLWIRVETAFEMEKWVEALPRAGVIKGEGGTRMKFPFLIYIERKGRDEKSR